MPEHGGGTRPGVPGVRSGAQRAQVPVSGSGARLRVRGRGGVRAHGRRPGGTVRARGAHRARPARPAHLHPHPLRQPLVEARLPSARGPGADQRPSGPQLRVRAALHSGVVADRPGPSRAALRGSPPKAARSAPTRLGAGPTGPPPRGRGCAPPPAPRTAPRSTPSRRRRPVCSSAALEGGQGGNGPRMHPERPCGERAKSSATFDELDDGAFAGTVPACQGVAAFGDALMGCRRRLQSTREGLAATAVRPAGRAPRPVVR